MSKWSNIIYALVDPKTEEVRYVGKSKVGMRRPMNCLCSHMPAYDPEMQRWKSQFHGWTPRDRRMKVIHILEILESSVDLFARETFWIHHYANLGHRLFNRNQMPKVDMKPAAP